jgi:multimeric flavodoxin WrbA
MKAIILLGSRNPQGQTARAAAALAAGVRKRGGQAETVLLPEMRIERCRQCEADGWGLCRTEGRCVIEDDFAGLVDGIERADAVVFATPVYWADLSESLRAFLDRLRRTCIHEAGKQAVAGKKAIGVCVAGGGGGGGPACAAEMVKILGTCGFDVVDMVLARRQNLAMKLPILTATGRWLAAGAPETEAGEADE